MSKVYAIIRATKEKTFKDSFSSLVNKDFSVAVIKGNSTLEDKTKQAIKMGSSLSDNFDWIMVVDADVIVNMSLQQIISYINWQERKTKENRFWCFTGYVDCSKRGLIHGLHFYKTKYCKEAYEAIKNKSFQYHKGREEYEICKYLQDNHNLRWKVGYNEKPFGIHLFYINNNEDIGNTSL